MTRWEPLDSRAAAARLEEAGRRLDLSAQIGVPPSFPELPLPLEAFTQSLSLLREAAPSTRRLALRGALEVALGRGTLPLAQNQALRTVTEALALGPGDLAELMSQRTGAVLPEPWDPSLPAAWRGRDGNGPGPGGPWDDGGPHPGAVAPMGGDRLARIKALGLLGLDEGASEAEIRRAFLRISRVHHPDHYAASGPEAAQEADLAFRRLKDAYEFLLKVEA
ncbi:J domain-containing protein [Geothrix limicola]|nr:J domain-containing protein [Geothrix limicola]